MRGRSDCFCVISINSRLSLSAMAKSVGRIVLLLLTLFCCVVNDAVAVSEEEKSCRYVCVFYAKP